MNLKTTKLIISGLLFIFALASCDKNEEINLSMEYQKLKNNLYLLKLKIDELDLKY